MENWLSKRLSPKKRDEPRWVQLAESFQSLWEDNFDPDAQRLLDLRSIFTAWLDVLDKIISELGDYFRADIGADEDKPMQIVWRRLELEMKDTDSAIQLFLKRKFLGLDIQWVPLYHKKTDTYLSDLYSKDEIAFQGWSEDDFFLTSRGKIRLASASLNRQNLTFAEFLAAVDEETERILPTHIIYMGSELATEDMTLNLYWGGVVTEGIVTAINMQPFVYS